jgi:tetratricopeptide (TPR) repeat protein
VDVDATSPADLAHSPAVRLFVERVRDVQPDFRLTSANGPTVKAICQRLDALPLALELAAPWIKVLTTDDLLGRLTHDVLFSRTGPRDLPERQQTINATVAWSFHLLSPDEQRVFSRLGALPGRFPIEAAAAVVDDRDGAAASGDEALGAVAGLIDKSLLLRAERSMTTRPLYQMLETVRAYAALTLTESGERDEAMEGLARYCAREASLAAEGLVGSAQVEWLDRVRDDLDNYRAGLGWLIDRGRGAEAAAIAWSLMYFWVIRGHAAEGMRWYEQILHVPSLPPAAESRALVGEAAMCYTDGDLRRARTGLTRALALAHDAEDEHIAAHAEYLFGHVEHAVGNVEAARARYAGSVERFQALAIPSGTGCALRGLAKAALAIGDFNEAERLLDQATSVLRHSGPWFLSLVFYLRAMLAVRHGNAEEAIALVRDSLAHGRQLRDKSAIVYAVVPLAAAAVLKSDDLWAARILGAGNAVTERTGAIVADKSMNDLKDRIEREVRARLGQDQWARAFAAGGRAPVDSLLADIDTARG